MHQMHRIQMGWKYQLKWSLRWMLYRSTDKWTNSEDLENQVVKLWQIIVLPPHHCYLVWYVSIDFCSAVPWKLLLKPSLNCCNNLTVHFNQFFCVSGSTYRFQCLYQINRKDLNKGKCVKADDNAGNIYMRTSWMDYCLMNRSSSNPWSNPWWTR